MAGRFGGAAGRIRETGGETDINNGFSFNWNWCEEDRQGEKIKNELIGLDLNLRENVINYFCKYIFFDCCMKELVSSAHILLCCI